MYNKTTEYIKKRIRELARKFLANEAKYNVKISTYVDQEL